MDRFLEDLKEVGKNADDQKVKDLYISYNRIEYFILKIIAGDCNVNKTLYYYNSFSKNSVIILRKIADKPSVHIIATTKHAMMVYFRKNSFTVFNTGNVSLENLCQEITEYTGKRCELSLCVKSPQEISSDTFCTAWAYLLAYLTCFYKEDPNKLEKYITENIISKDLQNIIKGFIFYIKQLINDKGLARILDKYSDVINVIPDKLVVAKIVICMDTEPLKAEKLMDEAENEYKDLFKVYEKYDNLSLFYLMKTAYSLNKQFFDKNKNHVYHSIKEFLDDYPDEQTFLQNYVEKIAFFIHTLTNKDETFLFRKIVDDDYLYNIVKSKINFRKFIEKRKEKK